MFLSLKSRLMGKKRPISSQEKKSTAFLNFFFRVGNQRDRDEKWET